MPVRATKRGADRTPLSGSFDVIVCGASFAGLTVARELAGADARVLVLDRYEIGEKQTSACAAPTVWLAHLGLEPAIRQTFGELVMHTARVTARWRLPWTFSTFDYRTLCELLWAQCGQARFETATVSGRTATPDGQVIVHTDRGDVRSGLVVDALGWRRVLSTADEPIQPPDALLSRGLEVHPAGTGRDLEVWLDPRYILPGYSWSFPAGDEVRVGVGSFDPRLHVRRPTERLAHDVHRTADRWQGNWIPHALREAAEADVFFVGDSAGHCLPATAEGIRPAFYFGQACGRELRLVLDGRQTRAQALARYTAIHEDKRYAFRWMLRVQRAVRHLNGRPAMGRLVRAMAGERFLAWAFAHYLRICPPGAPVERPGEVPAEAAAAPVAVPAG